MRLKCHQSPSLGTGTKMESMMAFLLAICLRAKEIKFTQVHLEDIV